MKIRTGVPAGRVLWLAVGLLTLSFGLSPALADDTDFKGFYVALDLGMTQPTSLDQHYANHVVFGTTTTMDRLVLDNDSDFTAKITFGYGFGEMGKLQVSWWGFDNEDKEENTLLGGVYPTIFGYGNSGGMYIYNPAGVTFSTTGKVQADTIDIDYIRSFEPGKKVTIGWLAGLRVASYEEDQTFEGADNYGNYYRQGKHFESDALGFKLGAKVKWGFTEHFGMAGSATWSFLMADTEGNSFQSFAQSGPADDEFTGSDDNIRGEIRDYDLKAVWSYGALDFWVGYAMSNWDGLVTDPIPQNEGGHFAIGPADNRGRDSIAFNSLHAGVAFKFGGGK
ncbi:MAG TPA: Lpg1974 family pore-forming outer membrane protein [Candidatus Polarisedimenticolia bacterium]|nr:Lpg1974 family pore-forming outer membrane protein [Candidatus Polarisedimenticolia bacterium]